MKNQFDSQQLKNIVEQYGLGTVAEKARLCPNTITRAIAGLRIQKSTAICIQVALQELQPKAA